MPTSPSETDEQLTLGELVVRELAAARERLAQHAEKLAAAQHATERALQRGTEPVRSSRKLEWE